MSEQISTSDTPETDVAGYKNIDEWLVADLRITQVVSKDLPVLSNATAIAYSGRTRSCDHLSTLRQDLPPETWRHTNNVPKPPNANSPLLKRATLT